jgi:hypothetical protein
MLHSTIGHLNMETVATGPLGGSKTGGNRQEGKKSKAETW